MELASVHHRHACLPPNLLNISRRRGSSSLRCINNSGVKIAQTARQFEHVLLPILDRGPYLSEATGQAAATATALAKKYGAKITVIVIDEQEKEAISDYEERLKTIRWHLEEGGFKEYGMLEKFAENKGPAVVIGEVADDMGLDLVVLSMESLHSKRIDGNLLAEFVPCPVLLLPLGEASFCKGMPNFNEFMGAKPIEPQGSAMVP